VGRGSLVARSTIETALRNIIEKMHRNARLYSDGTRIVDLSARSIYRARARARDMRISRAAHVGDRARRSPDALRTRARARGDNAAGDIVIAR
jgi:hypothetical protein